MINELLKTYFDTPGRDELPEIEIQHNKIKENKLLTQLLDAFPDFVVVLNMNRQIVAYNKNLFNALKPANTEDLFGQRLGEALNCIHAFDEVAGCGTSIFCAECGAAQAMKKTKDTAVQANMECRITKKNGEREEALDFRVNSSCIEIEGEKFILFTVNDIAHEKRRKALERTFFHDVLNTAGSVYGLSEVIPSIEEKEELILMNNLLKTASYQLISEIQSQRDLLSAENNTLGIIPQPCSINELLSKSAEVYNGHYMAIDKSIVVNYPGDDLVIETDPVLVTRSICNLLKNALEATEEGAVIKLFATVESDSVAISVNNPGFIPRNIQLQIFQRSFSTKSQPGHGIGTYSVKLLVENYLGGKASFVSTETEGTTFTIRLPYHVGKKYSA